MNKDKLKHIKSHIDISQLEQLSNNSMIDLSISIMDALDYTTHKSSRFVLAETINSDIILELIGDKLLDITRNPLGYVVTVKLYCGDCKYHSKYLVDALWDAYIATTNT